MSHRRFPALAAFHRGDRLLCESASALTDVRPELVAQRLRYSLSGRRNDTDSLVTNDEARGALQYAFPAGDGSFSAEEVAAMALRYAFSFADDGTVGAAVTVFPGADPRERARVADAAQVAEIPLAGVVGEHAAAAVAYAQVHDFAGAKAAKGRQARVKGRVAIVSVGAGGTWAALTRSELVKGRVAGRDGRLQLSRAVSITGLEWNDTVGARALHDRVVRRVAADFDRDVGCQTADCAVLSNPKSAARLRSACTKAVEMLTSRAEADVVVEQLAGGADLRATVTRTQFDALTADLIDAIAAPLSRLLKSGQPVAAVELIGGGARMPAVQRALQEVAGSAPLGHRLDKDDAVAVGASILAANLTSRGHVSSGAHHAVQLTDALPYPLWAVVTTDSGTVLHQAALFKRLSAVPGRSTIVLPNTTSSAVLLTVRAGDSRNVGPVAASFRVSGAKSAMRTAMRAAGMKEAPEKWDLSLRVSIRGSGGAPELTRAVASVPVERIVESRPKAKRKGGKAPPPQSKLVRDTLESEVLPVQTVNPTDAPIPLTQEQKQRMARRLRLLDVADARKLSRASARNDLEELAAEVAEALASWGCGEECEVDGDGAVSRLAEALKDTQEWLVGADDAEESDFAARRLSLQRLEEEARPLLAPGSDDGGDDGEDAGEATSGDNGAEAAQADSDCCAELAEARSQIAALREQLAAMTGAEGAQ